MVLAITSLWQWPADAIGPSLRMKTKPVTTAIRKNIRQALKPTFAIRSRYAGKMTSVAFSRDGKWFAASSENGSAQVWDFTMGQRKKNMTGRSPVLSVALSPDGRLLATGCKDGTVGLWNVETGEKIRDFRGHSGSIFSVAINRDGRFLATAGRDGKALLWDLKRGVQVRNLAGHSGSVFSLAFSQNDNKLVTGGEDGQVRVWDSETGASILTRDFRDGPVRSVAISSDDRYLAVGLGKGRVKVWDFPAEQEVLSEKAHKGAVRSVSISPDGRVIATAGDDRFCLWSLRDGKRLHEFEGHHDAVNTVCFTKDGKRLLTASDDRTVRFWEQDSGKEMARLISMREGWGVVSPEGYFDGTLDGNVEDRLDAIRWNAENRSFGVDGFLEGYYRPALLGRLMADRSVEQKKKVPDLSKKEFTLPPTVSIISPTSGSQTSDPIVTVTIQATDQGGGIDEIRLCHNGKVLDDTNAQRHPIGKESETKDYHVPLIEGRNAFRAVGFSKDRIESESAEVEMIHAPVRRPPRPALHLVTVGINEYKGQDIPKLDFCVPDVKAIAAFFQSSHAKLFDSLNARELVDEKADHLSIYQMMQFLQTIPPQDTLVVYFAGHGETIGEDEWYFLPYDLMDAEDESFRKVGISSEAIQSYVKQIPARRIIVLIDTCKSGAVLDLFERYVDQYALTLLSHATGIHLAAAAAKEQYASELTKLNHSLFTYALLQAFDGKADTAPRDGDVSVSEIFSYVKEVVPHLIKFYDIPDPQTPVISSRGEDFTVVTLKDD